MKRYYNKLRFIHKVFLYCMFAIVGYLLVAMLLSAAEIYEFPFKEMESVNVAVFLAAGIPLLILSIYILLIGHPVELYSIENPFLSPKMLEAHFKVKLDERNYEAASVLADDPEMKITIRRKIVMNRDRVFVFIQIPIFNSTVEERIRKTISAELRGTEGSKVKPFLTVLLGVEAGSIDAPGFLRSFDQSLPTNVLPVLFDFEQGKLSFVGQIDGLVIGKHKRRLKSFLAMLPEAQKYLDLEYLEGKERMNRDRIVWPFNPKKVPREIRFLWSLSCFALAAMGFAIGLIMAGNEGFGFTVSAVIVFIYAILMIGVGAYQLKNAIANNDGIGEE